MATLLGTSAFGMQWMKSVLWKLVLVLLEGSFCFGVPYLSLVMGKILPGEANDL
jgi:hypothetical protein